MTRFEYQEVHYQDPGEGVLQHSPDFDTALAVGGLAVEMSSQLRAVSEFLEETPNLNTEYQEQIESIDGQFKADGLEIDPVTVLGKEDYRKAASLVGRERNGCECGEAMAEQVIIAPDSEDLETYGPDFVLGLGLHEAAHSVGGRHNVILSRTMPNSSDSNSGDKPPQRRVYSMDQKGFNKYSWQAGETAPRTHGHFYEEAYADLKRVRSLREMGKSWDAPGKRAMGEMASTIEGAPPLKILYVGSDRTGKLVNSEEDYVSMPIEFAMGVKMFDETRGTLNGGPSNVAAYGLELMDQHVPGLFDDMEKARSDPDAYRSFVRKVDSIKPGLYKELRDLDYTGEDFVAGLTKIANALGIESTEIQG